MRGEQKALGFAEVYVYENEAGTSISTSSFERCSPYPRPRLTAIAHGVDLVTGSARQHGTSPVVAAEGASSREAKRPISI
jgi:hypothetical protein